MMWVNECFSRQQVLFQDVAMMTGSSRKALIFFSYSIFLEEEDKFAKIYLKTKSTLAEFYLHGNFSILVLISPHVEEQRCA